MRQPLNLFQMKYEPSCQKQMMTEPALRKLQQGGTPPYHPLKQ